MFGVLADYLGRRRSFIATLSLLILGAASSAASNAIGAMTVILCLALCRFVLGVGVGGEYPLSATVSSEASVATAGRGRRVSLVFSMQGVGLLAAPAVVLLLLAALPQGDFSLVWRLALGLGGLPALCMLYFRFRMKETAAFTAQSAHARDSSEKWEELKEHWRNLLATAGSWFIFDVVFYANSLFSSAVVSKFIKQPAFDASSDDKHSYLVQVALSTLYLALCALPGYFAATLVIDRWGRRKLQMFGQQVSRTHQPQHNRHSATCPCNLVIALHTMLCSAGVRWLLTECVAGLLCLDAGFFGMLLSYLLCGVTYPHLTNSRGLFYAVYGLSFFFCNMGPNVTTFVIPSELFPTAIRATAHGVSAASGKLGAALGTAVMPLLLSKSSLPTVLYVSAAISALGLAFTAALTVESSNINLVAHISSHTHTLRPTPS